MILQMKLLRQDCFGFTIGFHTQLGNIALVKSVLGLLLLLLRNVDLLSTDYTAF
jgi:hypothetical protein